MTNPRDKLRDGLLEPRTLDQFDSAGVATVLIVEPDPQNPGKTRPAALQGGGEGGDGQAAPVFLNPVAVYANGYTPPTDGTLHIQSLCRECYLEGYIGEATGLQAPPASPPVLSCGPEHWASVPVRAGVQLTFYMNGNSEAPHLDEVALVFLPGVTVLGGGPMLRHPLAQDFAPQSLAVGAAESYLSIPDGATHALLTVTAHAARLGLGDSATAPVYAVGEGIELESRVQLVRLRLRREGDTDATVRVDFWADRGNV